MKKILLIEDEKDIIKSLSTVLELEDESYEIHSAVDGQLGLEKARKIRPDLILLDIKMPNLSGTEVCRSLKSDDEYKSIPVIMLTALDKSDDIIKGLSTGADDYVTKPFNTPELLARIKSNLRNKELYDLVKNEEQDKSVILDISRSLSSKLEPHETLFTIVLKISEIIEVVRCSIVYIDPSNQKGIVIASHDSKELKHLEIDLGKYPEIRKIMETGNQIIINDVQKEPVLSSVRDKLNLINIRSIMAFPVIFKDSIIGTLILRTSRREVPFTDREIKICTVVSNLAAAPLKNVYLFETLSQERKQERKARIEAEEKSETSLNLLKLVKESSPVPICVFEKNGNIIDLNSYYLKEFAPGLKRKKVIGTNILKHIRNIDFPDFYKRILNGEKPRKEFESEPSTGDGRRTYLFHGAPLINANNEIIGGLFIANDITERKRMEENLSASEERYRSLVQTIPDIIYKIDMNGNFMFVNKSVRSLGYKPNELIGKHFSKIIHPGDAKSVSLSMIIPEYAGKKTGDKKAPKVFDERRTGKGQQEV